MFEKCQFEMLTRRNARDGTGFPSGAVLDDRPRPNSRPTTAYGSRFIAYKTTPTPPNFV
jgi:hypothetical protein